MIKDLVSIISPCYNGEDYVERFFKSILLQTYKQIELIFINDGSIDNTEKIALKYKKIFEENDIPFYYIYQENAGQAAALNKGLKIFKGEYLTWPDSDDSLEPNSIEKKVNFLKNHNEYGYVRTCANIINEKTQKITGYLKPNKTEIQEDLFEDFIMCNDVWFAPGCYMVKTRAFLDCIPERHIYSHRGGQNWQMLLPIAKKYKCGFINENLYNYYERENSHSHKTGNIEIELERIKGYEEILENVLNQLKEYQHYEMKLKEKNARLKMKIALEYQDKDLLKKEYKKLKQMKKISIRDKIIYLRGRYRLFDRLYKVIYKITKGG